MSTPPDTEPAGKSKSKKKILLFLIITLSVIATTILGLLGEVMPDGIQGQLKGYFNQKQDIWITLVVLLILIGILTAYRLTDKVDKTETEPAELTDEERQRFIKLLQNRYALRLQQKTGERFALKLELRYTLNAMQQIERLDIAARQPGAPNAELAALVKKHRNLLLMGQPGAGKTTLLLGTAIGLLQETANDVTKPLPVVFNLASWKKTEPSFAAWMTNILVQGYGYPPKRAAHAVQEGNLLLLLDGLDEVGSYLEDETQRNAERKLCLAAMQAYLNQRKSPAGMIVCTRTNEYLAAGGDAPVHAQLLIQPLDKTELQDCLQKISQGEGQPAFENPSYREANRNAAANLMQLTANSSNLADLLCTPFYFNAALQVLDKLGDGSISFVHDGEHTRQNLEALYINRTLSKNKTYRPEKIRRWLSWLAHWQQRRNSTSFELSSFGPGSFGLWFMQFVNFSLNLGLICSLAFGLIYSLVFGLRVGWVFDSVFGLTYISILGLVFGLIFGFIRIDSNEMIHTYDITIYSIKAMVSKRSLKKIADSGTPAFGIGLGVAWGAALEVNLFIGLTFGLIFGLIVAFFWGLIFGLPKIYFIEINWPFRRFLAGVKAISLLFASELTILYTIGDLPSWGNPIQVVYIGIVLLTAAFLLTKLLPLFQFIAVQLTLSRLGHLPFRMARFFDYCANELHLLEKDTGGSWRFRHQIIQDYFVKQYRSRQEQVLAN